MRIRLIGLIVALAALGACTPLQWQHPVYGTSQVDADLAACDHLAMNESWRYSFSEPTLAFPHVYTLPNGQRVADPYPRYGNYANTGELRNYCMRSKGYELVPVPDSS